MRPRRLVMGLAALSGMCAPAAAVAVSCASPVLASTASGGYTLRVSAPAKVRRHQPFTVTASGSAHKRSHLVIFLAQQPCQSSYLLEYNDIGARQRHYPYFQHRRGIGSKSDVSATYTVHGAFKVSVVAQAGAHTGSEHVCAYLPSQKPKVTHAHASTTYSVAP